MKLKDLLESIFKNGPLPQITEDGQSLSEDYILNKTYLEEFKDLLMTCDEFKDVTELILPDYPVFLMDETKKVNCFNLFLYDELKIKNKCYLYSINLTPPIFNLDNINSVVKNNASLTPTIYDDKTFTPYREIKLRWSPETTQDVDTFNFVTEENNLRQRLHETLDDILDNPKEYQIKPNRSVIIRGVFEYDYPQGTKKIIINL